MSSNGRCPHCTRVCRPDPENELIHVDCASHTYPDGSVGIHQMCFSIFRREIVALCGPNGSGKSTLIEHLNGLLIPSQGEIWFEGRSITKEGSADLWKNVGVVFQRSEDQLFAPTVLDDVMFGPINLGMDTGDAENAAREALAAVGATDLAGKLPCYLSGGQKRLVSIAGILVMKPGIIALDEPTSDLDPAHSTATEQLIIDLRDRFGISVVIATHDLDLAARIADRVCLVKRGSVFAEGTPSEIFYDADLIQEAGLRLPATVATYLDYCKRRGITPDQRPLRREDLVGILAGTI